MGGRLPSQRQHGESLCFLQQPGFPPLPTIPTSPPLRKVYLPANQGSADVQPEMINACRMHRRRTARCTIPARCTGCGRDEQAQFHAHERSGQQHVAGGLPEVQERTSRRWRPTIRRTHDGGGGSGGIYPTAAATAHTRRLRDGGGGDLPTEACFPSSMSVRP
jgi:hypothetical protein